jgi:hypothetical protein
MNPWPSSKRFHPRFSLSLTVLFVCFLQVFGDAGCGSAVAWADSPTVITGGWDSQASFATRTYPFGAMSSGQVGYGKLLWGPGTSRDESGSRYWQYGYVRPSIQVQAIGVTNRVFGEVEFYPISILGFAAGSGFSSRQSNVDAAFDCAIVQCNGTLWRDYVRTQFVAGAWRVFVIGWGRYEKFRTANDQQKFREEGSALVSQPGSDALRSLTGVLGFTINKDWNLGIVLSDQTFIGSQNNNQNRAFVLNHFSGPWRWAVGIGDYVSSHQSRGYTANLSITWIGIPSLQLIE